MILMAILLAVALQGTPDETRVPLDDLTGLTLAEVEALTGAAPGVEPRDAIRIVAGGRTLDLYPLRRFWRQPNREGEGCLTGFEDESPEDNPVERSRGLATSVGLLAFEDGRLLGVYRDPSTSPLASIRAPAAVTAQREQLRQPRPASALAVSPGRLPLSDGAAVLERLEPSPIGSALVSLCRTLPASTYRSDPGMDLLWGLVGLAALPALPFRRAADARADRDGGALLASLEAGEDLCMSPEDWAGRVRGTRVLRDPADPEFAVIAIRLGSGADTVAKVGLLGVRGLTVIWKVERDAADHTGLRALICRDPDNRSTNARPGCSTTGFLLP